MPVQQEEQRVKVGESSCLSITDTSRNLRLLTAFLFIHSPTYNFSFVKILTSFICIELTYQENYIVPSKERKTKKSLVEAQ